MGRFLLFWGGAARCAHNLPALAGKLHTCGLRSVFLTHTPQGGFSCRFAAIHLLSSEKTIKIICRLRAANAAGRAGLFAAVRQMRHDKSLWKAPRALGHGAFLIF